MIDKNNIPRHVAIIMDGNNRWAKLKGMSAVASGHSAGAETIRGVLKAAQDIGVKVLTLFAFSSENWTRPRAEVDALMRLFAAYLKNEVDELHSKGVRVRFIGRRDRFNDYIRNLMDAAEEKTAANEASILVIAADYGGMWDVSNAARLMTENHSASEIAENHTDLLSKYVALADLPAPDLLIRTGGEHRISNFLLWQCAYAEMYFTDTYWPDFDASALEKAITCYQQRERRFGKTSEQVRGV